MDASMGGWVCFWRNVSWTFFVASCVWLWPLNVLMESGFPFAFLLYPLTVHNFLYNHHHHHHHLHHPLFGPDQLDLHCSIEMRMYGPETHLTFSKSMRFFYALVFMWWKYIKKYHQRLSNILKLPKKLIFGPFFTTSFVHKELRKLFRELFYLFFLYYEKGKIPTLISWLEFAYIRKD